jgi:hypothetical protein
VSEPVNPYPAPAAPVAGPVKEAISRGSYVHGALVALVVLIFGIAALDRGTFLIAGLVALVLYAAILALAARRGRKGKATKLDAILVRWGFLPVFLVILTSL